MRHHCPSSGCAGKDKNTWITEHVHSSGKGFIATTGFSHSLAKGKMRFASLHQQGSCSWHSSFTLHLEGIPGDPLSLASVSARTTRPHHVWVIPVAGASRRLQHILVCREPVQDGKHAVPGVLDVIIVTPQVADLCQDSVVHLERSTGSGRKEKGRGLQAGGEGADRLVARCSTQMMFGVCKAQGSGEEGQSHIPI